MIQVKCIEKIRDKNGKIYGYKLQDLNQQTRAITSGILKDAIRRGEIEVVNLKLTSDNKLIDRAETKLNDVKLGVHQKEVRTTKTESKVNTELERSIAKAFVDLDLELCGMGDNYLETVEEICETAEIEFDMYKEDTSRDYIIIKAIEAYEKLIKTNPNALKSNLEHYHSNADTLYKNLIYYRVSDLSQHKILSAVNLIAGYVTLLYKSGKIDKTYRDMINELFKRLRAVDLKLCYIGYKISTECKQTLDINKFTTSIVHHISFENTDKYKMGLYTAMIRLRTPGSDGTNGYILGFNRDKVVKDKIEISFYSFKEIISPTVIKYEYTDLNERLYIVKKDMKNANRMINQVLDYILQHKSGTVTNEDLIKLTSYCGKVVTKALKNTEAKEFDRDSSLEGRIQTNFELDIKYKGTDRQLDVMITIERGVFTLNLGLVNLEPDDFCTELDEELKFVGSIESNMKTIDKFLNDYVTKLKNIPNTKYSILLTNLYQLKDMPFADDLEAYPEYKNTSSVIYLMHEENFKDLIELEPDSINREIYPYMFDSEASEYNIIHDWEESIVIAFIDDIGNIKDILVYSDKNIKTGTVKELRIINEESRHKYFCEDIINMSTERYKGHVRADKHISQLRSLVYKNKDAVLIEIEVE